MSSVGSVAGPVRKVGVSGIALGDNSREIAMSRGKKILNTLAAKSRITDTSQLPQLPSYKVKLAGIFGLGTGLGAVTHIKPPGT